MRPAERYRLIARLGEGSLGVVHRALDLATNREVALKIMPRARGTTHLRGEFVALARLRHPNVVSVLDYGLTDAGHEYFTMELVAGPSLADAVGPLTERRWWALLAGVVDALASVHAVGMVHADVKPSNILVDGGALALAPERAARLADFGLVTPLVDPGGATARGTIGYAAPEAWSGRLDPRSDLYSFGVVLWQLVVGARPFAGATPRAVVAAQRAGGPGDPRRLRPDLPPALADLMVALLDPAPGARPESADEVLDRWRAIADAAGHRAVLAGRGPSVRSPRRAIAIGSVIGRDRELAELERTWAEARTGRGAPVLVIGEPGIGKSRLLAELGLHVQLDGGELLRVSAQAGDAPWAAVRSLARALLTIAGPQWARAGSTASPHLANLLADGALPTGPGRWVLAEGIAELVVAAAAVRPLAIIVDDADQAAPAVTDVLAYLIRAIPDVAALLLIAARSPEPAFVAATPSAIDAAVAIAARGRRFELAPLGQSSFYQLTAASVGVEVAARVADELRRVSGGNPGHALATLDAMIEAGTIARVGGAWTARPDLIVPLLPATRQSALGRLSSLAPASRGFLRAAAVLGDPFDRELLATILGISEPRLTTASGDGVPEPMIAGLISVSTRIPVLEVPSGDDERSRRVAVDPTLDEVDSALVDGVAARVLIADPAVGRFRFTHKEIADTLGRELTPAARLEYHRRAALAQDDRLAAGLEVSAAALARHYRAMGDGPLAARWCLAAASDAVRAGDLAGAVAHATDALALADPGEQRPLIQRVAELAAQAGELELALHHFHLAADGAGPIDAVLVALEIADLERRRGHGDAAIAAANGALAAARRTGDPAVEARCHLRLGWLHAHRADYPTAGEHAAVGLALARRQGDRLLTAELARVGAAIATSVGEPRRALALLDDAPAIGDGDPRLAAGLAHELGRAAIQAGDYPRAITALERAVTQAETAGDLEQRARSLNNLGAACYYQGDWPRARRLWEQFRQQSERQGDRVETVHALNNLGSLYRDLGMLADARAALDRAGVLAEQLGHAHMAAMVLANRGEVDARAGDVGPARERYERTLAECLRLGAREDAIETRRRLSELDLMVGRVDEALSRALEAARDAKDIGARFEEGVLHRVAGAALRGQGDLESAAWFLERARELLANLGARHELARVAVEIAELAHAQGDDERAQLLLAAAEAELSSLGARWDLDRVRAQKRVLGAVAATTVPAAVAVARAAAAGDSDQAIDLALAGVVAATGCDRGFVLTLDGQGRPQIKAGHLGRGARRFDRGDAEVSGTIVRKVAATGGSVAVADAVLDADLREQSSVIALGLRRVYAAPLRARGRLAGIVYADSSGTDLDERALDPAALEDAVAPLAFALDHARLIADARRSAELMSILAHEIRNPLAGILGYSDMGREAEPPAPAAYDPDTTYRAGPTRRDTGPMGAVRASRRDTGPTSAVGTPRRDTGPMHAADTPRRDTVALAGAAAAARRDTDTFPRSAPRDTGSFARSAPRDNRAPNPAGPRRDTVPLAGAVAAARRDAGADPGAGAGSGAGPGTGSGSGAGAGSGSGATRRDALSTPALEAPRRDTIPLAGAAAAARRDAGAFPRTGRRDTGSFTSPTLDSAALFDRIHQDAERLRRLVDNVFELSRHEAGRIDVTMSPVDVERVVKDVAGGFARALEDRHLTLALTVTDPLGPAQGNADRLAQVVSNLLGNAIKFSPDGGTISVGLRRERVRAGDPVAPPVPPTDARAWIPIAAGDDIGDVIRLDVRDRGPGMSAELRAQLFEKFTQGAGAAKHGGIGLGLYLCREIVRQHGGSIWVESELGDGALFAVRLPVAL